jgi:hypothetical protein
MKRRLTVIHRPASENQLFRFDVWVLFPRGAVWSCQAFKLSEWEALDDEAKARILSGHRVFEPNAFN